MRIWHELFMRTRKFQRVDPQSIIKLKGDFLVVFDNVNNVATIDYMYMYMYM